MKAVRYSYANFFFFNPSWFPFNIFIELTIEMIRVRKEILMPNRTSALEALKF